ncbi:MAG: hypothetical protein JSW49_03915 [candidate division WOR-3 bacterium]|nr:MAG: hypothetical protein JSW49_03915 [candidate division WOR-3 bacterium]
MGLDFRRKKQETKERHLIPRKKYPKPFRFVGPGIIITFVVLIILYRIIVC